MRTLEIKMAKRFESKLFINVPSTGAYLTWNVSVARSGGCITLLDEKLVGEGLSFVELLVAAAGARILLRDQPGSVR